MTYSATWKKVGLDTLQTLAPAIAGLCIGQYFGGNFLAGIVAVCFAGFWGHRTGKMTAKWEAEMEAIRKELQRF